MAHRLRQEIRLVSLHDEFVKERAPDGLFGTGLFGATRRGKIGACELAGSSKTLLTQLSSSCTLSQWLCGVLLVLVLFFGNEFLLHVESHRIQINPIDLGSSAEGLSTVRLHSG